MRGESKSRDLSDLAVLRKSIMSNIQPGGEGQMMRSQGSNFLTKNCTNPMQSGALTRTLGGAK